MPCIHPPFMPHSKCPCLQSEIMMLCRNSPGFSPESTSTTGFSKPFLCALLLGALAAFLPTVSFAQRPLGIDVSSFQGASINWSSVKGAGYIFAWAKATEGATVNDADFTVNANNGK